MLFPRPVAVGSMALALLGCADLPEIPANQCGNFVREANEDCDGYVEDPSRQRCRGPSEPDACRYDCSDASTTCPNGWSCGNDQICHSGTGTYQRWGAELAAHATALRLGDFDGNGRADLLALGPMNALWQSEPRVVFFDAQGDITSDFDPQALVSFPTLSEPHRIGATSRPQQRVIASTYFGIAELLANAKQQVTPVAYPFQSMVDSGTYRMIRVRGVAAPPLNETVLLYQYDGQLSLTDSDTALSNLGRPLETLSSDPIAVNFDPSTSPCDKLVFTFQGDRHVYALELCDSNGHWLSTPPALRVIASLPEGYSAAGAIFALLNDDALLDLVVGDEEGRPYVTFGLAGGVFAPDLNQPDSSQMELWPAALQSEKCPFPVSLAAKFPLAVGDLNGDRSPDWVLPDAVALVNDMFIDAPKQRVVLNACAFNGPASNNPWSVAHIVDLNRDGLPDLIAGSTNEWNLSFLVGTGEDFLNQRVILTEGPVSHIVTGDFDGDRNTDIAFVQQVNSIESGSSASSVAISFGVPFASPTAPSKIAEFVSVDQLANANYVNPDTAEEIGVTGQTAENSGKQLVLFVGNAGRHPIAALGLNKAATGQQYVDGTPLALTTGHFLGSETEDVLALAMSNCDAGNCPRLWYVPRSPSGRLTAPIYSEPLAPDAVAIRSSIPELSLHFATGQLDNDGLTDALLMTSSVDEQGVDLWRVRIPSAADASFGPGSPLTRLSATPGRLFPSVPPLLLDLDGDQIDDLVTLLQDQGGNPHLIVTRNEFGSFDLNSAISVDVDNSAVRALTRVGSRTELLILTDHGVYLVGTTPKSSESRVIGPNLLATPLHFTDGTTLLDAPTGAAIAVGDVTGDGLLDLAIAGQSGVRLYAEVPIRQ